MQKVVILALDDELQLSEARLKRHVQIIISSPFLKMHQVIQKIVEIENASSIYKTTPLYKRRRVNSLFGNNCLLLMC